LPLGKGLQDTLLQLAQYQIDNKLPLAAPITNEVVEAWKNSKSSQPFNDWINDQWNKTLQKMKDEK